MPEKIFFAFENLSRQRVNLPERWTLKRGSVREIWESFLDSVELYQAEKFRAGEDLIQFSTQRANGCNRKVLMWHEAPAETDDFLYAYYPMSLIATTSYLTNAHIAIAVEAEQQKIKKE